MRYKTEKFQPTVTSDEKKYLTKLGNTDTERISNLIKIAQKNQSISILALIQEANNQLADFYNTLERIIELRIKNIYEEKIERMKTDPEIKLLQADFKKEILTMKDVAGFRDIITARINTNMTKMCKKYEFKTEELKSIFLRLENEEQKDFIKTNKNEDDE